MLRERRSPTLTDSPFTRPNTSPKPGIAGDVLRTPLNSRSLRGMRKHCHAEGSFAVIVSHSVGERARASQRSTDFARYGRRMKFTIRPLTPDLWPAFEDLFGDSDICSRCWCMYWRIGAAYRRRPGKANKAAFREIVKRRPPPGLLAFDDDVAVGWCQLTSRDHVPELDRAWCSQSSVTDKFRRR